MEWECELFDLMGLYTIWLVNNSILYFLEDFKIIIFHNNTMLLDRIDLDNFPTLVMNFNGFNNVFTNYFYLIL